MKEERTEVEPYIAPEIARGLEQTQIGIYHTPGGHGFAAEDANILADRGRLKKVVVTGTSYQTGATTDSDQAWQTFAYTAFDPACLAIVRKRPKVTLPAAEHVQAEIVRLARAVAIGEPEIPDQHR